MQNTYLDFIHGQSEHPLPVSKLSQSLQKFYILPYNERYYLQITTPSLTAFLKEQVYNIHPADLKLLQLLQSIKSYDELIVPSKIIHLKNQTALNLSKRQKLSEQYIKHAEPLFVDSNYTYAQIYRNTYLISKLPRKALHYYKTRNLEALINFMMVHGRSEHLDTLLFLLISGTSQKYSETQKIGMNKIYKGDKNQDTVVSIITRVVSKIRDPKLRLLCLFCNNLTLRSKMNNLLKLEYLLRSPKACVYDPNTYGDIENGVRTMQNLDADNNYADYTYVVLRMLDIYKINYVINNIQSFLHKEPKNAINLLVTLSMTIPSMTVLVKDKRNGQIIETLNQQNIDLFFKDKKRL
jgi:hypothetical protein